MPRRAHPPNCSDLRSAYDKAINTLLPYFQGMVNGTLQDAWATVVSLQDIASAGPSMGGLSDWYWKNSYYPWSSCMVRRCSMNGPHKLLHVHLCGLLQRPQLTSAHAQHMCTAWPDSRYIPFCCHGGSGDGA